MDLFKPLTRDERQLEAARAWIKAKGHGTIEAATGFGKTRVSFLIIEKLLTKYPEFQVLVVVPTDLLRRQWEEEIDKRSLGLNVHVKIINSTAKNGAQCDLLIIDEIHTAAAYQLVKVFESVKYKAILGLTATFARLDERHKLLEKYCPIIDTVTLEEALLNGWVSQYKEYLVLIDVDDIDVYQKYTKEFNEHFGFFGFDFGVAMGLVGKDGWQKRKEYTNKICTNPDEWSNIFKQVTYHATALMRVMQARKKFIFNHPDKLRIAEEIIAHRKKKKIVTFNANVAMAESYKEGYVYTGKETKKKNRITLEEFSSKPTGILHTCKLAEAGMDIPGLSVGIMTGVNSSEIKSQQTRGRVIRKEGNKEAEYFTLVINDTVELKWWENSHKRDKNIIKVDEEGLMHVLNNEPFETYKRKLKQFNFRF